MKTQAMQKGRTAEDMDRIWKKAKEDAAAEEQLRNIEKLKAGDPKEMENFLASWDAAVEEDKRITAFRNRTEEEKEAYREKCRQSVENNRWKKEPERTAGQLIEDARRSFRADMPVLYHAGEY